MTEPIAINKQEAYKVRRRMIAEEQKVLTK